MESGAAASSWEVLQAWLVKGERCPQHAKATKIAQFVMKHARTDMECGQVLDAWMAKDDKVTEFMLGKPTPEDLTGDQEMAVYLDKMKITTQENVQLDDLVSTLMATPPGSPRDTPGAASSSGPAAAPAPAPAVEPPATTPAAAVDQVGV